MATAKLVTPEPSEIDLRLTIAEAQYVRAALLLVNPSKEARELGVARFDPVYDALGNVLPEFSADDVPLLALVVGNSNEAEGTLA